MTAEDEPRTPLWRAGAERLQENLADHGWTILHVATAVCMAWLILLSRYEDRVFQLTDTKPDLRGVDSGNTSEQSVAP